ncbi:MULTISPECIES: type IV pilus biogenesis/stability protein PilW [unclassified Vibrio]|uniref:type IV pilus biogenesis/stability protein PilW n=1 Tax=unclassified Vibrio TaxID=2614977 RepID=UPI001482A880|nr:MULTISPECIES: type IV pilus biogenesis/stability protein PilW [unclassified Vibrio]NNN43634.1 type IV pilus biogenesis/stability protein PilW [Vibrio sp. 1-1(7)]NNN71458.1 type IV pilus biogenesis/stability protein PilW [Vibrio sp. 12-2(3-a)]
MKYLSALTLSIGLMGCVTITEQEQAESLSTPIEMAESRIELGLGYLENGSRVKARQNLEIALQHAPHYYRSQLSMAHYFETVGEKKSAARLYQQALRDNPHNGNVLNNYGTFLCKEGDYAKADQFFIRAVEQPYYYLIPASYENAAFCALKANDALKAKQYFKRALEHDPTRINSLLQLAKLQMDDNEFNSARIHLMQLHQRYGYQKASLQLLIELEQRAGNHALEKKYQTLLDNLS